ncbi:anti-sigma factor [Gordonia aurantiaca]|uniref:anti-sigma factor n=1 Tax=Gordonia sp. B21 TaxID=3151852 RepID=UPI003265F122
MAEHLDPETAELLALAPIVGLDAASADELRDIGTRVAAADEDVRDLFAEQVRATREAMAAVSGVISTSPPPSLRDRVLAAAAADAGQDDTDPGGPRPDVAGQDAGASTGEPTRPTSVTTPADPPVRPVRRAPRPRRMALATAAAVAALAVGSLGWVAGLSASDDAPGPPAATARVSPAERVFSADDLRSTSVPVATGNATIYLAASADTAVLVMNSVPPPQPGTVYQMWLVGPGGARSAGTMSTEDVEPVTTAVLSGINSVDALAFTVEPPGGSARPTGAPVAQLALS